MSEDHYVNKNWESFSEENKIIILNRFTSLNQTSKMHDDWFEDYITNHFNATSIDSEDKLSKFTYMLNHFIFKNKSIS